MWSYNYTAPNELYHHGVKGMKWGVRKASSDTPKPYRQKIGKGTYANWPSKQAYKDAEKKRKAEFKSDVKQYRENQKELSDIMNSIRNKGSTPEKERAASQSYWKANDFIDSTAKRKGEAYVERMQLRSTGIDLMQTSAVLVGVTAVAAGYEFARTMLR